MIILSNTLISLKVWLPRLYSRVVVPPLVPGKINNSPLILLKWCRVNCKSSWFTYHSNFAQVQQISSYEDSVAAHLSKILTSDQHSVVISSAKWVSCNKKNLEYASSWLLPIWITSNTPSSTLITLSSCLLFYWSHSKCRPKYKVAFFPQIRIAATVLSIETAAVIIWIKYHLTSGSKIAVHDYSGIKNSLAFSNLSTKIRWNAMKAKDIIKLYCNKYSCAVTSWSLLTRNAISGPKEHSQQLL